MKAKAAEKKLHRDGQGRLGQVAMGAVLAALAILILVQQLATLPYGAGSLLRRVRQVTGDGVLFSAAVSLIPVLALICFFTLLAAAAARTLSFLKADAAKLRVTALFFALLLADWGDIRRVRITYALLHSLLNLKGLAYVLLMAGAVYLGSRFWRGSRKWMRYLPLPLLFMVYLLLALLYQPLEGLWRLAWGLGYFGAVCFLTGCAFCLEKQKRSLFVAGILLITAICGQSVFYFKGMDIIPQRNRQLLRLMEMYDCIRQQEGTDCVAVFGNNRGLALVLAYDDGAFLPYRPDEMSVARKSRLYASEGMTALYKAADKGEDGLGLLTTYAAGNGYRYLILWQKDGQEYSMVTNGGYQILYETEDFQLYYK